VQHRHPYTKGQSNGANNQYPHETTAAHDQNLPCAGPTFGKYHRTCDGGKQVLRVSDLRQVEHGVRRCDEP
jgi:hypothetical protein